MTYCYLDRCIPFKYRNSDGSCDSEPEKIEVLMINSQNGPGLLFPKVGYCEHHIFLFLTLISIWLKEIENVGFMYVHFLLTAFPWYFENLELQIANEATACFSYAEHFS